MTATTIKGLIITVCIFYWESEQGDELGMGKVKIAPCGDGCTFTAYLRVFLAAT
jgi:hypothetical protein